MNFKNKTVLITGGTGHLVMHFWITVLKQVFQKLLFFQGMK